MHIAILILVSLVVLGAAVGVCIFMMKSLTGGNGGSDELLQTELKARTEQLQKFEELFSKAIPIPALRAKAKEIQTAEESLKAERGRITITQAELETVETRLRELEEIQRELDASGLETKEELKILERKQEDLKQKNDTLKEQIAASSEQIESVMSEIEMNAQMREQIQTMKGELLETEQRIEQMLQQINQSNEQYFVLKKRYDALDIEYAQLYEKFTEAEALLASNKEG